MPAFHILKQRQVALLLALALLVTALPFLAEQASAGTDATQIVAPSGVVVSERADRTAPQPIEHTLLAGDVFIFMDVPLRVRRVTYYLDDPQGRNAPFRVSDAHPFDLEGASGGQARPLDTTTLDDGEYTLTVNLELANQRVQAFHAPVVVANGGPPTTPETDPAPGAEPAPAPEPSAVHTPPSGIADDCSQDETAALNAWLQALPDHATARLAADGCYRAEHTVQLKDKTGVTIDGNGATLRRTQVTDQAGRYPRSNSHLRLVNTPDATVTDLRVEGTNDGRDVGGSILDANGKSHTVHCYTQYGFTCYTVALEFEHGIDLRGAPNATIAGVTVDAVWGDGAYVSGGDQFTPATSSGAVLTNFTVARNGRQGIAIVRSSDVLVDGADIQSSRRAGIDIEPDTAGEVIRNIEIRNSTVHSWLLAFASGGRGNVSDVYIHDNTVTRSGVPFVYVAASDGTRRANWRVEDNAVPSRQSSLQPAMRFDHVDNVSVLRNTVNVTSTQSRWFIGFTDVGGILQVKGNDAGGAITEKLYTVDGVSLARGVDACGNTTSDGAAQPIGC